MNSSKKMQDRVLTDQQQESFVRDGFIKLENAFPAEIASEGRAILWRATGCDPENRTTWASPTIWLGDFSHEPFQTAANTKLLHAAFDEIVGFGRWVPRNSLGGFVVRFPHSNDPGDTGWHIDASFPSPQHPDSYTDWRVNVRSDWRALLMLFLFSDVGEQDSPTRIRIGSHLTVARLLAPAGEEGMTMMEISKLADAETQGMQEITATGAAGTVYLCHPFLLHAGQAHHGSTPRFMGQPPLIPRVRFELKREDKNYSLVEVAIRLGIGKVG